MSQVEVPYEEVQAIVVEEFKKHERGYFATSSNDADSRLKMYEKSGHALVTEQAEEAFNDIIEFYKSIEEEQNA